MAKRSLQISLAILSYLCLWCLAEERTAFAQNRYATSDNMSGYVHWIDLYDASNTRIDPAAENPRPYSPAKTCGRCHDYTTISHGWHFNAVDPSAEHGRPGQPWIWSDHRTGTHLPLSYRDWPGTLNPDDLGLSRWQVAAKLGGYMPGGGVGSEESLAHSPTEEGSPEDESEVEDRSNVTGSLPVDCMMCHHNQGSGYSPFVWTEQIEDENFAYAPVAALGLATVSGSMARLKDDFDPQAEDAASKLPKMVYELSKFRGDGKVFFDLVRKPKNDSCYYCHTNMSASSVAGERWLHDEDVHLRAGLGCADCHRNALDHHTVRGFEGENHVAGSLAAALSCQGCHVGDDQDLGFARSGRLGAPKPLHRGLPPLHFDKLTCTACHSGPLPNEDVPRQINSVVHRLGEHVKRTGDEFPGIVGPVHLPVASETHLDEAHPDGETTTSSKYTPHRLFWPSFWGTLQDGKLTVLNPESVYDLIRRPLKVRREFTEELSSVRLSLSDKKELLGEDRARAKEEDWSDEERAKISQAEAKKRTEQVGERMAEAFAALEKEFPDTQAVFVSGGVGYVRQGDAQIKTIPMEQLGDAARPYAWPIGHNVRPARQALGASGCLECHSDNSLFFQADVVPVGLLPDQEVAAIKTHQLQGADMARLGNWNQLFAGRSLFKIVGLVALALTGLVTLSAMAWNLGSFWRRPS